MKIGQDLGRSSEESVNFDQNIDNTCEARVSSDWNLYSNHKEGPSRCCNINSNPEENYGCDKSTNIERDKVINKSIKRDRQRDGSKSDELSQRPEDDGEPSSSKIGWQEASDALSLFIRSAEQSTHMPIEDVVKLYKIQTEFLQQKKQICIQNEIRRLLNKMRKRNRPRISQDMQESPSAAKTRL
ncbi:hypothetical protein AB6A40_010419 [Gnathostoma spinigerum]|uniref:Uncharacterized protein n=1 Tax=Gnathostoma spinigerum TaxID=75299 RepID=A0ABD6EW36_9BILA